MRFISYYINTQMETCEIGQASSDQHWFELGTEMVQERDQVSNLTVIVLNHKISTYNNDDNV